MQFFFALPGPKKVPWPTGNFLAQSETVDDFSAQILALFLAHQFKALYIEMGVMQSSKLCDSSSFVLHQLLDVLEKLRCYVSQGNLPHELKQFPIKVVPFSAFGVETKLLLLSCTQTFADSESSSTEAEKAYTFAVECTTSTAAS